MKDVGKWIGVSFVVGLIAVAIIQTLRLGDEQRAHLKTKTDQAELIAGLEQNARLASEDYRRKEDAWRKQLSDIDEAGRERLATATAAAVAADVSRQRMRDDYEATIAAFGRAAAEAGDDAGKREATDAAARMLADVQRRYDQAAGRVEGFADRSYAAATTCWEAGAVGR